MILAQQNFFEYATILAGKATIIFDTHLKHRITKQSFK